MQWAFPARVFKLATIGIVASLAVASPSAAAQQPTAPADVDQAALREVETLIAEVDRLRADGKVAEMEPVILRAIDAAKRALGAASAPTLVLIGGLGEYYVGQRRYREAEPPLTEAAHGLEAALGPDDEVTLTAIAQLAALDLELGRFADAVGLYRGLLDASARAGGRDSAKSVDAIVDLGFALHRQGRYDEALPLYLEAVAGRERLLGADHPQTLFAQHNLAILYHTLGRYSEAEALYLRVLESRDRLLGPDHADTLASLHDLGLLLVGQNRFAAAEPILMRVAEARARTLGAEHEDSLSAEVTLAGLHVAQRRYAEAEARLRRVRKISERTLGPEHPLTLGVLDALANAHSDQGQYQDAEALLQRVVAARERLYGPEHDSTSRSRNALALAYLYQGEFARAEPLFLRALEASDRSAGPTHPESLNYAGNLVYSRLHVPGRAGEALEPARRLVAAVRARRGSPTRERGEVESGDWFTLLADAGWIAAESGRQTRDSIIEEVFTALQDSVAGETNESIARMAVRRYAEQAGTGLGALVREREELGGRWEALADEFSLSFGDKEVGEAPRRDALDAERERLEARMSAIDATLRSRFPAYFALIRSQPMDLSGARTLLRPDDAILLAVPTELGTHVIALTREGSDWVRSPWTANQIDEAVQRLRWQVGAVTRISAEQTQEWQRERPSDARLAFDRGVAFALYRQTVAPVEALLAGKRRIYVVAGGSLAALPFSLLVAETPTGGDDSPLALRNTAWLGDRAALVHLPSIQSLSLLRQRGQREKIAGSSFIGFGDPVLSGPPTESVSENRSVPASQDVFVASGGASRSVIADVEALRRLPQLPGTDRELQRMGEIFDPGHSRIYTRAQATERFVRSTDLSSARVIAFATHGLTPTETVSSEEGRSSTVAEMFSLAQPGLVLTPPATGTEQDDGYLSASEVSALRLDADWVILSACNTATGDAATAGLSQLARAFLYAGARNLLASHWNVDDEVAPLLTTRTIELERGGMGRPEAFQQAMREVRMDRTHDSVESSWAHPFFWAPFVLIGDGGL